MKILVTLKDPDGFSDAVSDAVKQSLEGERDEDEREACHEIRTEKCWEALEKYVTYQEYVTIEFDTEIGTARVVETRE